MNRENLIIFTGKIVTLHFKGDDFIVVLDNDGTKATFKSNKFRHSEVALDMQVGDIISIFGAIQNPSPNSGAMYIYIAKVVMVKKKGEKND